MEIVSIVGIVVALILLSYLCMKNVNILVAALACSLVIAITGGIDLYDALKNNYMESFVGFFRSNFLVFVAGAVMGKVYEITNSAKAIALLIVSKLGSRWSIISIPIATGILAFGGISGFVLVFTMYPIALEVFRKADVPRRFIPCTLMWGITTFALVMPGTPQTANVVLMNALGTQLMSGLVVGLISAAVVFTLGVFWLLGMIKKAKKLGESFVERDTDKDVEETACPNGWIALIPLVITVTVINLRIEGSTIISVEYGVFLCAVLSYLLLRKYKTAQGSFVTHMGNSMKNAFTAISNTCSVVGFGGVVSAAAGFPVLMNAVLGIPGPPLLAVVLATAILVAVAGSGTGGLGIVAPILGPIYTAQGVSAHLLHRMMALASIGFDDLPHNGFVNTILGVTGETHKSAYGPIFKLSIVVPTIALAIGLVVATLFPNLP